MKDTTKRTIQNVFVGQFSNARAIEGAKTAPWWIAVVLFILGTFLPVIPIMLTQANAYGAQFVNGTLFGYDQYITQVTYDLAQATDVNYKINGHKLLKYNSTGEEIKDNTWLPADNPADMKPIAVYDAKYQVTVEEEGTEVIKTKTVRKFEVYYTNRPYNNNGDNTIYQMVKTLTGRHFEKEALTPTEYKGEVKSGDEKLYYNTSFMILSNDGLYSYIYKTDSTTMATSTGTGFDWSHQDDTAANSNFFKELAEVNNVTANPKDEVYVKGVLNNWKVIFNNAYANLKTRNFWMLTGIFYGIFIILNLFMGFMLWLLTRGKRNPNRGLKVLTCLKIAGWICFLPGLLAMIFGFMIPAAQQILFIMLIGLRTMWLAMKQLNPKY